MKILLIGSGGREHALAWKLAQSKKCDKLYAAPGSDGMSKIAERVDIKAEDIKGLVSFARQKNIGLTVVGPEAPLVAGIADVFIREKLKIFAPEAALAAIEGSKVFAKEFMKKAGVPTADFRVFDSYDDAENYLSSKEGPIVIKADGLASGKGVQVCRNSEEGKAFLKSVMVDRAFGDSGRRVVIEECLKGEEASIIVISDGKNVVPLASSQDHKRAYDGDKGPNTGGMGAYSPAPVITDDVFNRIMDSVIYPVIRAFVAGGRPYKGALYAGIMMTDKGPFVLEFNARFGDPETQAIMPRLKSDLVDVLERAVDGKLENYKLEWDTRPCVSVVVAAGGYPGRFEKGMEITGLDEADKMRSAVVFHAGTKLGRRASDGHNLFITNGGRVLNVTALGIDYKNAIDRCYEAVRAVHFEKMYYRTDIGYRAVRDS